MRILSLILMMFSGFPSSAALDEWRLALHEKQIKVYTSKVEGSPYIAVKAELRIDSPLDRVADKMGNDGKCAEWRKNCKSARLLERVSENEQLVYTVMDLPWPLTDRDLVNRITTERCTKSGVRTVTVRSEPDRFPNDEYIRAIANGGYELVPISDTATQLTFIMHSDLGDGLPAERINQRLPKSTLEDFIKLRDLAEAH